MTRTCQNGVTTEPSPSAGDIEGNNKYMSWDQDLVAVPCADDDGVNDDDNDDDNVSDNGELFSEDQDRPPDFYLARAEEINNSYFVEQDYAASSTEQLNRIERHWYKYCEYMSKDPVKSYHTLTTGDLDSFFTWMLNQRRGKGGRKCRGTKLSSSLSTYWKQFRLVYERATTEKLDPKMNRQMHRILRKVAKENSLSNDKREKAAMDMEDVKILLQTNLTTTQKRYPHGRHRIQVHVWIQGGFTTGNRPQALLDICYRHIAVTLLRDPSGGPHRILLEWTFEFTKEFLGMKDTNTFPIPEIICDPSLILSPHVFLLGLLFADAAFLAPTLTSPEQLSQLDIPHGCNALPVPLKPTLNNVPIFRQSIKTLVGYEISPTLPLPRSTLSSWLKSLGEITGFLQVARPYCLRYGAGRAFDENGGISDALRNVILQHADTRTFIKHYLPRRVTADTQAIVRGTVPQEELMRAACRMSRWIDPRRPYKLTAEQSSLVNDHPRVRKLIEHRNKLKAKSPHAVKHRKLTQMISNEKQRLRHATLKRIRKEWDAKQAVTDIEEQLLGSRFSEDVKTKLESSAELTPEHKRLIETVMSLPASTIEDETRRRNAAINAVAAYCRVEEGGDYHPNLSIRSTGQPQEEVAKKVVKQQVNTDLLEETTLSVYKEKRPTICFLCLGNERLPIDKRIYSFKTPGDLSKHFRRKHLSNIGDEEQLKCNLCNVTLKHKMHLQNHAHVIHGTVS